MVVSIDVPRVRAALRVGTTTEETTEITRLYAVAKQAVEDYAPNAPSIVQNEALVRYCGWLLDMPFAMRGQAQGGALRNSGAAAMLAPYVVHRAGIITTAVAAAAAAPEDNPVVDIEIAGTTLRITYADNTIEDLTLPTQSANPIVDVSTSVVSGGSFMTFTYEDGSIETLAVASGSGNPITSVSSTRETAGIVLTFTFEDTTETSIAIPSGGTGIVSVSISGSTLTFTEEDSSTTSITIPIQSWAETGNNDRLPHTKMHGDGIWSATWNSDTDTLTFQQYDLDEIDIDLSELAGGGGSSTDDYADSVSLTASGNDVTVTVGRTGTLTDLTSTLSLPRELPAGGADEQILAKSAATDYAVEWIDAPSGGGGGGTPTLTELAVQGPDSNDQDVTFTATRATALCNALFSGTGSYYAFRIILTYVSSVTLTEVARYGIVDIPIQPAPRVTNNVYPADSNGVNFGFTIVDTGAATANLGPLAYELRLKRHQGVDSVSLLQRHSDRDGRNLHSGAIFCIYGVS